MLSLGIDIAGAPGKELTLALIQWGPNTQTRASVSWEAVPLGTLGAGYPAFQWPEIAHATGQGNVSRVADLSFPIAVHVCHGVKSAVDRLGALGVIDVFAIDSPSGFSRNTIGHGRATEKVGRYFGLGGEHQAYFQMSPSIACNRTHQNQWAWMLFGMATFHAIATNFTVSRQSWEQFLLDGFDTIPEGLGGKIIEVFPRAMMQHLRHVVVRQPWKLIEFRQVLAMLANADAEVTSINHAIDTGSRTGSDRADSLIAGLTTLGKVYPGRFVTIGLNHQRPSNYNPGPMEVPWLQEGVVYVIG